MFKLAHLGLNNKMYVIAAGGKQDDCVPGMAGVTGMGGKKRNKENRRN